MPKYTASEIVTQKHVRFFVQPGGASPANPIYYGGQDNTYLNIESGSNPISGGRDPIRVHDPRVPGRYRDVAVSVSPPDLPTATVQFMQKLDMLPRHLTTLPDCATTFYQVVGDCKDLSDFVNGWSAYVKIYANGEVDDIQEAGGSFDADDGLQDELSYTFERIYNVGRLGFDEKSALEVYSEARDVVYGSRVQCGNCGPDDNGTKLLYAVTDNTVASPGQAPSIVYSLDGGLTWTEDAITGAASTDVPQAIAIVGQRLIVVFDDGSTGGYFFNNLNTVTGEPASTWIKVTTGFVAARAPKDVVVLSPREVWFCGEGGYLYRSTDITSGVSVIDAGNVTTSQLNRIDAHDNIIVAVGETGTVIYSTNRGESFGTTTANPSSDGNDALAVVHSWLWWVGDDAGNAFYTEDRGRTWVDTNLSSTTAAVQDIVFVNDEVGYMAVTVAGPIGLINATFNGGRNWTITTPRINNLPTFDRANRLAFPDVPNQNVAVNNLAVAGLAGNGSDGIVLLATAPSL